MTTSDVVTKEYVLFPFPRLSRKVNRDLWIDRFVNSMLMRSDGSAPEWSWILVAPKNWPEGFFVPDYFDVVAVFCEDMSILHDKYAQYAEHMEREYRGYAERAQLDIDHMERFCSVEPWMYEPSEDDVQYSDGDRSALRSMRALYQLD